MLGFGHFLYEKNFQMLGSYKKTVFFFFSCNILDKQSQRALSWIPIEFESHMANALFEY